MDPAIVTALALIAMSYLLGSIPVGAIVARFVGGPDLRSVGSGRTGGTNALRALGRKWAAVVVLGDLAKGAVPVLVARAVTGDPLVEVLCGAAAVTGAIWSIFAGFRSGRGVGTGARCGDADPRRRHRGRRDRVTAARRARPGGGPGGVAQPRRRPGALTAQSSSGSTSSTSRSSSSATSSTTTSCTSASRSSSSSDRASTGRR